MDKSSQEARHEKWRSLVEAHQKSGLSQKEFCKKEGLVFSQFGYYRGLFKKSASVRNAPTFSPVKITENESVKVSGDIRISLPNGFQCIFPCHIETPRLRQVLEVLLSC